MKRYKNTDYYAYFLLSSVVLIIGGIPAWIHMETGLSEIIQLNGFSISRSL